MGKKLKGISTSCNDVSNTNLIIASDSKIQLKQDMNSNEGNERKSKKQPKDAKTEHLSISIIKTYEKYFV
jgi:hypothetical protein